MSSSWNGGREAAGSNEDRSPSDSLRGAAGSSGYGARLASLDGFQSPPRSPQVCSARFTLQSGSRGAPLLNSFESSSTELVEPASARQHASATRSEDLGTVGGEVRPPRTSSSRRSARCVSIVEDIVDEGAVECSRRYDPFTESSDGSAALRYYEVLAGKGAEGGPEKTAAQFMVGWLLFHGYGGARPDRPRAHRCFFAAAEAGHVLAAHYVGLGLEASGESLQALDKFVESGGNGCAASLVSAGRIILAAYAQGIGSITGYDEAMGLEFASKGTCDDVSRKLF